MKLLFISLFISFSFYCYSQGNPNSTSVYSRIERISLDLMFNDVFETFSVLAEPEWLEEHKPSELILSKIALSGSVFPDIASLQIDRDAQCRAIEMTGSITNIPGSNSKCRLEYDDPNKTITITYYSYNNGTGPEKEYLKYVYTYDQDQNITKIAAYEYDLTLEWDNLVSTSTLYDYDNCGNNKYQSIMNQFFEFDYLFEYEYLIDTCLVTKHNIKDANTNDDLQILSIDYFSDYRVNYAQLYTPASGACTQTTYTYDGSGKRLNLISGDCDSIPSDVFGTFNWNPNNSLAWVEYHTFDDTIPRVSFKYGACDMVKVNELHSKSLQIKSPIVNGENIFIQGLSTNEVYNYLIFDLEGRCIQQGKLRNNTVDSSVSDLIKSGCYFITVSSGVQNWTGKFIVI